MDTMDSVLVGGKAITDIRTNNTQLLIAISNVFAIIKSIKRFSDVLVFSGIILFLAFPSGVIYCLCSIKQRGVFVWIRMFSY